MKTLIFFFLTAIFSQFTLTGCSKKDQQNPDPLPPVKAVYAVGHHIKNSKAYTTVWKDGTAIIIDSSASAFDTYLSGSDLYVAGQKNSKGIVWKNGVSTQLNSDAVYGYVTASSIHVNGSDVHIAGFAENGTTFRKQAMYWKNNIPVLLNAGANTEDSYAQSIFVNGTDVYVAGLKTIAGGGEAVVVWKNGVAADLISSTTISYGNVNLYVSGNDVYVTCYEYNFPVAEQIRLWKNGAAVSMPVSILGASPYCLFVNGTDVYIGGFEREGTVSNQNSVAKYWKNGTPVTLADSPNGADIVRSIYVDDTDVYAAGAIGTTFNSSTPMMWKNGTVYPLSGSGANPFGDINSVFVK